MRRRQEGEHAQALGRSGGRLSEGMPVEDINYDDLEGVRKSVPRSSLNRNVDPSEYAEIEREASNSDVEVPHSIRFEDGYRMEATALERSVLPALTDGETQSINSYSKKGY